MTVPWEAPGTATPQGAALPDAVDDPRWESIPTHQLVDARTARRLQMPTGVQVLRSDIEIAVRFVCVERNIRGQAGGWRRSTRGRRSRSL
jgi:hypothetical protein